MASVAAGVVVSAALVRLASADQCPDAFTQAQVDASDCIVGANIGLGLVWLFAIPPIMALALWAAALLWRGRAESIYGDPPGS